MEFRETEIRYTARIMMSLMKIIWYIREWMNEIHLVRKYSIMKWKRKFWWRENVFLITKVILACQLVKCDLKVKATKTQQLNWTRYFSLLFIFICFFCGIKIITRVNIIFILLLRYICHGNIIKFLIFQPNCKQ